MTCFKDCCVQHLGRNLGYFQSRVGGGKHFCVDAKHKKRKNVSGRHQLRSNYLKSYHVSVELLLAKENFNKFSSENFFEICTEIATNRILLQQRTGHCNADWKFSK